MASGRPGLAIHAAQAFARENRYDEVQLWADLRGFSEQDPADPGAVLEMFLHALGVPAEGIPPDLEERAALYRERLSGLRALILLDNAFSEDQVRPLLPGGSDCVVLVTTRRSLGGLDGATSICLDVFPAGEAVELLTRILGPDRVEAEPAAAADIVRLAGYLPLAVSLAARRLRSRACWRLADLAARLQADAHRLDQLCVGSRGVRVVFELSYQSLPPVQQQLFRSLGLHPGDDFTAHSTAALVDMSPQQVEPLLDALLDAYLLEQAAAAIASMTWSASTPGRRSRPKRPPSGVRQRYGDCSVGTSLRLMPPTGCCNLSGGGWQRPGKDDLYPARGDELDGGGTRQPGPRRTGRS